MSFANLLSFFWLNLLFLIVQFKHTVLVEVNQEGTIKIQYRLRKKINGFNTGLKLQKADTEWIPSKYCPWQNATLPEDQWGKCSRYTDSHQGNGFYYDPLVVETENITSLFCPVYKSGSTAWRRVILKALGYDDSKYLAGVSVLHKISVPHLEDLSMKDYQDILNDENIIRWMVVRNPYMRLYSAYNEKFAHQMPEAMRRYHEQYNLEYVEGKPASFQEFVQKLYQQYLENGGLERRKWVRHQEYKVNVHFAWQTSFCSMQDGFGLDYVLKSEQLPDWYPFLIEQLNLTNVVKSGWPTTDECFLSVPTLPCNGPLVTRSSFTLNSTRDLTENEIDDQSKQTNEKASYLHRRNSKSSFFDAYSVEIAGMVTQMYYKDLVGLGYPIWDGQRHTFQIV